MVQPKSKPGSPLQPELTTAQKVRVVIVAIWAVLVLIVVVQNTGPVEAHLLLATFTLPLAVLLFSTLVIGFILGIFFRMRLRRSNRRKS